MDTSREDLSLLPPSRDVASQAQPLDWERDGRDWPNRSASTFINAGGMRWHLQRLGTGPVLLLVHGTGASTHSWRDLAPRLSRWYTVIAPDLPGHGFTHAPPGTDYSLAGFAAAVARLLNTLNLRPVLAIGHSAGAAILAHMCLEGLQTAPRAIISLNGALLPLPGLSGIFFPPMARFLAGMPMVPRVFARHAAASPLIDRLLADTGSTLDPRGTELYTRLARNPAHVAAALSMMARWNLATLEPALPRLKVPVVLVAADNDRTVPPRQARHLATRIPGAQLVRLTGLGHLAHEEAPRRVAALVLRLARQGALTGKRRLHSPSESPP